MITGAKGKERRQRRPSFLLRVIAQLCMAFCLVLISFGIFSTPVQALNISPRFTHLTTEDGLSHDIVYSILQDSYGYLWFGTQDGLNRYDGYNFTVFRHHRSDPNSLVNNTINVLFEDHAGTLWVGTIGGLDSYGGNGKRFIHHTAIPPESIGALFEDTNGILWVGTIGSGLFRYDPVSGEVVHYQHEPANSCSLSENDVQSLYVDHNGTLWVGTSHGGLNALNRTKDCFTHYIHDTESKASLSEGEIKVLYEDSFNTLWVGTGIAHENDIGGLDVLDRTTGQFIHYRNDAHDTHSLSHNHIQTLYEDHSGKFWVGTENGLNLFDQEKGNFRNFFHDPLDAYSLSQNDITAIYEDRSGNLWFGTKGGGINHYAQSKDRFRRYNYIPNDPNSIGAPNVGAIVQDSNGAIWLGLYNGGLDRLDPVTGQIVHYRHEANNPHSLIHDHVAALAINHRGILWIGTAVGLDRFDPVNEQFVHYIHDPENPLSLGAGAIKVILEDHNHDLWIGTEDPGTLSRLDSKSGTFIRYDFIPTFGVRAILEDQNGDLWIGTYNGLVHFNRRSETFIQYRHDEANPNSLSNDFIWAIALDRNGILWIGTHSGLNRFDPTTEQFTTYTIEDGLPNDAIASILIDEKGQLWLGTMGGGLSKFTPETGAFRNYDVGDGLQGEHFIIGSAYKSLTGEMFFGGLEGFNTFYSELIQENPFAPPIVLTALRKFDQVLEFETPFAELKEITFSYQDNFFAFEFAALDYTDPARNQYAYQLEGFDQDWIYCGTRRYASYTNLPPGEYTFRVKGSNNDGVWNEEGIAFHVLITPPYWATGWFRSLMAAIISGVIILIYKARSRNISALREREERYRALFENAPLGVFEVDLNPSPPRILRANREATRIYGRTAEELENMTLNQLLADEAQTNLEQQAAGLNSDQTLTLESKHRKSDGSEFPARVSLALQHTSRQNPLAIVIVEDITAEKAWRSQEEAIIEERRRIAHEIHDGLAQDLAALRMKARLWHQLVDKAPEKMHIEIESMRNLLSKNIHEVRRAIFALRPVALEEMGFWPALHQYLDEFGEQNQLFINLEIVGTKETCPVMCQQLELMTFRIIQEALNNVAKHAQAQTVWVTLDFSKGVTLRVQDDGIGFDPAALPEMARKGHLGLQQMRERVESLDGKLEINSQPGHGVEICAIFKNDKDGLSRR